MAAVFLSPIFVQVLQSAMQGSATAARCKVVRQEILAGQVVE
jgi:hypothetical protein